MQGKRSAPHVFMAVLNWGLGHATRSCVLIEALLRAGVRVSVGADGAALKLLHTEWPQLPIFELPAWHVSYPRRSMAWNMLRLLPHFVHSMYADRRAIQKIHRQQCFDAVISDNRYGCYLNECPSILLTHQLFIRSPWRWSDPWVHKYLHAWIRRFSACWVPDWPNAPGLSGALGHGQVSFPLRYVGPLSRMQACRVPNKRYEVAAILSGPEPQRTYLEQQLIAQWFDLPLRGVLVQGLPERQVRPCMLRPGLLQVPFLPKGPLNRLICESEVVVCRSGYSSLMDLAATGAKALLVPTPGQTEQEYLAAQLAQKEICVVQSQATFNLAEGWQRARQLPGLGALSKGDASLLDQAIAALLAQLP